MTNRLKEFLKVRTIRVLVGRMRLFYFVRMRRELRTLDSDEAFEVTVRHNMKSLKKFGMRRMSRIIKPLTSIETVGPTSRILVIGPRNEDDLLLLAGEGHRWDKIQGCDLISYSPKITLGDMHELPFDDDSWDVVVCGWTLSYSRNPQQVANELLRVVKPGGLICVAVEYSSMTAEETEQLLGYTIADRGFERINSVDQILDLFGKEVGHLYFSHDAPARRSHSAAGMIPHPSSVVAIFSVRDADAAAFRTEHQNAEKVPSNR